MIKDFSGMSWQFTAKMLCWSPCFQIEDVMADRPQKAISSIWKKLGLGELVMTSIWKNFFISSILVARSISDRRGQEGPKAAVELLKHVKVSCKGGKARTDEATVHARKCCTLAVIRLGKARLGGYMYFTHIVAGFKQVDLENLKGGFSIADILMPW